MWCQTGRGLRTSPVFFLCAAWMPRAGYFRHEQGKEWKGRSEGGQANPTTTPTWTHAATAMTRAKEVNLHMRFLHPLTLNFPHSPPLQPLFQLYFCKSLLNFLLDDMFALCLMYVLNYRIFPGSCKTACNNVLNSEISPSLPPSLQRWTLYDPAFPLLLVCLFNPAWFPCIQLFILLPSISPPLLFFPLLPSVLPSLILSR